MKNSTSRENSDSRAWWILAQVDSKLLKTFSGYQSLLALYLSGTPSQETGTRPPSCLYLDNHLCMYTFYCKYDLPLSSDFWALELTAISSG